MEKVWFAGRLDTVTGHVRNMPGAPHINTVRGRMAKGMTLYEAINSPRYHSKNVIIEAFGAALTAGEWSKRYGVRQETILKRIRKYKWHPERAVSEPTPDPITAFGRTQSRNAWARETGIAATTIYHRIHMCGMSPELALSMPKERRGRAASG